MVDLQRAILDELMGRNRNALPTEKKRSALHFTDPEVCKYYICGFCPNELFTNTKSDLGACNKVHDEYCRTEFQNSPQKSKYPYEKDWIHYLERLIDDLDRRIKRGHDRLEHQEDKTDAPLTPELQERFDNLSNRIQQMLKQIENLGEQGRVDESQQLMKLVDQLKNEKEQLVLNSTRVTGTQEKKMKVCETCGAFLVVGDTEKRMISHLEGKQHQGYTQIRKALEEWRLNHRDEKKGGREYDKEDRDREFKDPREREDRRDPRRNDRDRYREYDRRDPRDRKRPEREREDYDRDRKRSRGDY